MPLKTLVKVSHLSNLSDARYCSGMGVELLGFRAIPGSEHHIAPEEYQDIRGWIAGPGIVAELYGLTDAAQLEAVMQAYAPDYLELTYDEYTKFADTLTLPCIIAGVRAGEIDTIREAGAPIAYLLVDENASCSDVAAAAYPVIKKTTSIAVLEKDMEEGCFKGFELEGPETRGPGITNYDQLGEILEALEAD